jgi:CRP-like cAMP-binding protein
LNYLHTDNILSNLSKHIELDSAETKSFLAVLKQKEIKRKDYLLQAGQPCTTFNYVDSGALRAFYRDRDDKEATIMFAVADWWITDMPCFVNEAPANINIQAIADTNILQLTKTDLDSLLAKIPKFEKFFRIIMQNAYIREQLRVLQSLSLPAEVRYQNFLDKYPSIARQVTQKHIASYLGITPEFLSVIRKKMAGDKFS